MPMKKIAITLPQKTLSSVDKAAQAAGLSRSAYVARILASVAQARTDEAITRRINELLDDELIAEGRETAAAFQRARVDAGTEW